MSESATVSVIIPARNEQDYIAPTLRALFLAIERIGPAPPAVEVIIVDNDCTDETVRRALEFPVRIAVEKQRRISAVRNTGAREARGKFLVFLDADSRPSPNALARIHAKLRTGRCAGGGVRIRLSPLTLRTLPFLPMVPVIQVLYGISAGMIFATREAFEAVGGFDQSIYAAEDLDFVCRLKRWALPRGLAFASLADVRVTTSVRKFRKAPLSDFLIFPMYLFDKTSVTSRRNCRLWYDADHR